MNGCIIAKKEAYSEIQEDSDQNPCHAITGYHCCDGNPDYYIRNAELQTDSIAIQTNYDKDSFRSGCRNQ